MVQATSDPEAELVAALQAKLDALGGKRPRADLAARLGINPGQLTYVLQGKRRAGAVTLAGITGAYPDLRPLVGRVLRARGAAQAARPIYIQPDRRKDS